MTPETQAFGQQFGLVAPKPTVVANLLPTPAPAAPAAPVQAVPMQPAAAQPTAPSAPVTLADGTQLDSGVVKVLHAIRNVESNGDYTAIGDNGSSAGAFQWNNLINGKHVPLQPGQIPANFQNAATSFGLDPTDFSPANQNKVAYAQIAAYKAKGLTPLSIDALWNGASPDQANPGQYIHNNPQRATTFQTALQQEMTANPNLAQPSIQAAQTPQGGSSPSAPSFLGNLGSDFANRAQNLATNDANYAAGNVNVASHVLQDAGQVAGGVGDVFSEALGALDRTFTGGAIGGALNSGVHALASTGAGQAVAKAVSDFSTAHPEASANIGAIANIASLFPVGGAEVLGAKGIAEGAGALGEKLAATDLAQSAGKSAAKDVAANLEDIFTNSSKSTVRDTFEHMVEQGQNPAKVLVDRKLATQIPIEDGHVRIPDNSPVMTQLADEEAAKSQLLDKAISQVKTTQSADQMKTQVNDIIAQNRTFRQQGRIPEMQARAGQIIDNYVAQEGKSRFRLIDIQGMKKGQTSLSRMYAKAQDFGKADEHSALGFAFQKMIEDNAPDVAVRKLNKQVGELIATQNLLTKLDGATIRGGRLGKYGARILGATIGSQGSIPIVSPVLGAFMGDAIVSGLQKAKIAGPINRLLMKVAQVAPDNTVVKETQAFIEAVESGEKFMPSDDVAEFLARASAKANIPLLPPAAQDALRSVISSGPTVELPAKSLSTLDAEHAANPNIKNPQRLDGLSSTIDTTATAKTMDKKVNIPPTLPPTK